MDAIGFRTQFFLRFSVLSLRRTSCEDLRTGFSSCDLEALCRRSEVPLMYGTEAYILFSLTAS